MKLLRALTFDLFFTLRFFYSFLGIIGVFVLSFAFPGLYPFAWMLLLGIVFLCLFEIGLLFFNRKFIYVRRDIPEKLSNGDENPIPVQVTNELPWRLNLLLVDDLPEQLQIRDFDIKATIKGKAVMNLSYQIRPTKRGIYKFGKFHVLATSLIGFVQRRFSSPEEKETVCYPAFLQLRSTNLNALANQTMVQGSKKIRRASLSTEFDQIKEYVLGDDIRTINWKSTARRSSLMVNTYTDEKSQDIYAVLDLGRTMEMPFQGLSLLDHSINASLMFLALAHSKYDRVGMFGFDKQIKFSVPAEKRVQQMQKIQNELYAIETNFQESSFYHLYIQIKNSFRHRSLMMLYTNFESMEQLERNLPYLRGIAKLHLLIVVLFENSELRELAYSKANTETEYAEKVMARANLMNKKLMLRELRKNGISCFLTAPENLTVDVMNKYLEVKGRGLV